MTVSATVVDVGVVAVGFVVLVRGFVVLAVVLDRPLVVVLVVPATCGRVVIATCGSVLRVLLLAVSGGSGASVGTSVSGVLAEVLDGGVRDAAEGPPVGFVSASAGPPTTSAAATPPITGRRR